MKIKIKDSKIMTELVKYVKELVFFKPKIKCCYCGRNINRKEKPIYNGLNKSFHYVCWDEYIND